MQLDFFLWHCSNTLLVLIEKKHLQKKTKIYRKMVKQHKVWQTCDRTNSSGGVWSNPQFFNWNSFMQGPQCPPIRCFLSSLGIIFSFCIVVKFVLTFCSSIFFIQQIYYFEAVISIHIFLDFPSFVWNRDKIKDYIIYNISLFQILKSYIQ